MEKQTDLSYQSGFNNFFSTESLPGAIPSRTIMPQKPPYGLYAEQLSGDAFTALNHDNQRSWLYRILPSVKHSKFSPVTFPAFCSSPLEKKVLVPDQLRWSPMPFPKGTTDFIDGIFTYCANGSVSAKTGNAIHMYAASSSMDRCFYNSDGDFLIVPQEGSFRAKTEFGILDCRPGEILCIPRGIKFQIILCGKPIRGYICENYGAHFQLPYKGPIGANGLANARDFLYPQASFEEVSTPMQMITKFGGGFFESQHECSPFDVVAWHGNYAPYKYDLANFMVIGSISFDHPDPSIFTVLTSQTDHPGVANLDFVIFPDRWMVAEDTFRPPYYHRNTMSEFMGLIYGAYDAKAAQGGGFEPGGASLHSCMSAHGPDAISFDQASESSLKPVKQMDTLAFMFESTYMYDIALQAIQAPFLQNNYQDCWHGLRPNFARVKK